MASGVAAVPVPPELVAVLSSLQDIQVWEAHGRRGVIGSLSGGPGLF